MSDDAESYVLQWLIAELTLQVAEKYGEKPLKVIEKIMESEINAQEKISGINFVNHREQGECL